MTDFSIKQNDTAPAIKVKIVDASGDKINFDNVNSVLFSMYSVRNDENVVDEKSASVFDDSESIVIYSWDENDTETVGHHKAEFEVEYKSGSTETFPNSDNIDIYIEEELS